MIQQDKKLTLKSTTDAGWFSGYASVYECLDLHKDIVAKGAFTETLKGEEWPKMLWQHDPAHPIGRWEKIEETEEGLYVEGRLFLEIEKAREAFVLLCEGVLNGLSIGFQVEKSRRLSGGRLLATVRLYEISLVTFPANGNARVLTVKNQDLCADLLEKVQRLRESISRHCEEIRQDYCL